MPGSCIPSDVDPRLIVVLIEQYLYQVNHAFRIFCVPIKPGHLIGLSTQGTV